MHAGDARHDNFWCSAGVHPDNERARARWPTCSDARRPRVVAIGETGRGIDYYRLNGRSGEMEWQRERFPRAHPRRCGQVCRWWCTRSAPGRHAGHPARGGGERPAASSIASPRPGGGTGGARPGFSSRFRHLTFRTPGTAGRGPLRAAGALPDRDRRPTSHPYRSAARSTRRRWCLYGSQAGGVEGRQRRGDPHHRSANFEALFKISKQSE